MRSEDGTKWLTVKRLVELLEEVPSDSRVMVNTVGNLLVLNAVGTESVAFIDFLAAGEVEMNENLAGTSSVEREVTPPAEALKPCPFCGGSRLQTGENWAACDGYVHCDDCGGHMEVNLDEGREAEAIRRWNTRIGR